MRKAVFTLLFFCVSQIIFAASYRVEVAVFEESVSTDYFYGLEDVKLALDVNSLYRYYLGDFSSLAAAESAMADAVKKGFKYAKIIDMDKAKAACAMACQEPLYVQNIFFDYDKSFLRTKSKNDLDNLVLLLQENPSYKVELSAHTDSHGSTSYNNALSQRRSNSAKDYLIAKGIATTRISTSEFGEDSPIAKNDISGEDSPAGRQFNRRVVITVMDKDGKVIPNVVRPIDIPDGLEAN